jgi:hypothetical protein
MSFEASRHGRHDTSKQMKQDGPLAMTSSAVKAKDRNLKRVFKSQVPLSAPEVAEYGNPEQAKPEFFVLGDLSLF